MDIEGKLSLVNRSPVCEVVTLPAIAAGRVSSGTTSYAYEMGDASTVHGSAMASPADPAYRYYTPYDELWTGLAGAIEGYYCYWVDAIGFAMLKKVELSIGGNVVDTVTSEFLFCWEELTGQSGKRAWDMVGRFGTREERILFARTGGVLHIPLPFWYTQITGNALSLITLSFNSVKLHVTFELLANLIVVSNTDITPYKVTASTGQSSGVALASTDLSATIMSEMIYLDVWERNSFLMGEFDNLMAITQITQFTISTGSTYDATLSFNFPVMELIVACRLTANATGNRRFCFNRSVPSFASASGTSALTAAQKAALSRPVIPMQNEGTWQYYGFNAGERYNSLNAGRLADSTGQWSLWERVLVNPDPITDMTLYVNNNPRMNTQTAQFHRHVHPKQHHSRIPTDCIYVMSFAMFPEEANSSGSLNFSRLDNARLRVTLHTDVVGLEMTMFVFARSWNLFTYTRGVGGTKFVS
jgi:hypothetical protein